MPSENERVLEIQRLLSFTHESAGEKNSEFDPFAPLQLNPTDCDLDEVKKSYRKISLLVHPDHCNLSQAGEAFTLLNTAYEMLSTEDDLAQCKQDHREAAQKKEKKQKRKSEMEACIQKRATDSQSQVSSSKEERVLCAVREEGARLQRKRGRDQEKEANELLNQQALRARAERSSSDEDDEE